MTATGKYLRIALGVVVIAALIIVPMNFNRYGLFILSQWAVMTIAAMGLNLTLGYAGQVSVASAAFGAIGGQGARAGAAHESDFGCKAGGGHHRANRPRQGRDA